MIGSESEGRLFVYGSLIFPEVWKGVVGSPATRTEPAELSGYSAFRVIDEAYPGLVKTSQIARTQGVLIFGLTLEDWKTLDVFEGEFYERVEVNVETVQSPEKEIYGAHTYLVSDGFEDRLSEELWDVDEFAKSGLADFLQRFV